MPPTQPKIEIRMAELSDVDEMFTCQEKAYEELPVSGLCNQRLLKMQIRAFPEGQLLALLDGKIVGYATSLIVQIDEESPWYSYSEITGNGTFSSHTPSGDTLYGADIAVDPDHRGKGIAGDLYRARKRLLTRFNLRRMVAGGRIPGYEHHAGKMSAEEYVELVKKGELKDSALNAHLKAGYEVRGVYQGYIRDARSLDYATFLELKNKKFKKSKRAISSAPLRSPVRRVRVCAAQYEMRSIKTWKEFETQVTFFVECADQYGCHFLLFPEYFTAQLFSTFHPELPSRDAITKLTSFSDQYISLLKRLSKQTGIFIIGGTHPIRIGNEIRNVAHLFTPNGQVCTQEKLHITPNETLDYGIQKGNGLRVFDTGLARIAIVICYDIEFPEISRLLTLSGAEILFVPFSTDEKKAYLRVRYSAQARAIENFVYLVLAGNVGNLPQVDNFLLNYGESAILTPSDFEFPPNGIAASADPNTETVVITDLDLGALAHVRENGSVRPLRDRRVDLYELRGLSPVELIRTY